MNFTIKIFNEKSNIASQPLQAFEPSLSMKSSYQPNKKTLQIINDTKSN